MRRCKRVVVECRGSSAAKEMGNARAVVRVGRGEIVQRKRICATPDLVYAAVQHGGERIVIERAYGINASEYWVRAVRRVALLLSFLQKVGGSLVGTAEHKVLTIGCDVLGCARIVV